MVRKIEIDEKLLLEYYKKYGSNEASKIFNVSVATIWNKLNKITNIHKRKNIDVEKLKQRYVELKSLRKTAKEFGVSVDIVVNRLKSSGIIQKQVRFCCDDYFFSRDTAESFYWAGFIAADGCISKHRTKQDRIIIEISRKDEHHLDTFRKAIKFTGNLLVYSKKTISGKEKKYVKMAVSSQKMADNLKRFNIVPNKTKSYTFPEWIIKHKLVNHFMRGYSDGDGCFYKNKQQANLSNNIGFVMIGTKKFVSMFCNILKENCKLNNNKKIQRAENIFRIGYFGTPAIKIRNFLYKDSNRYDRLERKFNIAFDR